MGGGDAEVSGQEFGARLAQTVALVPDLTWSELDSLAGITRGHSRQMAEGTRPRVDLAGRVADVLGVSLDWLVRGVGEQPPGWLVAASVKARRDAAAA